MILVIWDLGQLTDWLGLLVNAAVLASGLLLLWLTRRSLNALIAQMRSQSSHQIFEAHKTLFMPIVESAELAQIVSGGRPAAFKERMLGSMLINHASRIFAEFANSIRPSHEMQPFRDDLRDLFSIEVVRKRWPQVQSFHDPGFVRFVADALDGGLGEEGFLPTAEDMVQAPAGPVIA